MYDRGLYILEQYGLEAKTSCKGRGVLLYETQDGWISIKEFHGTKQKLEQQFTLMEQLKNNGFPCLDHMKRNSEGELLTRDKEENAYVVREWHAGTECDTRSITDIARAVEVLAHLHKVMHMEVRQEYVRESLVHECERHNVEMRKTRKFIQKRQRKNAFEMKLLSSMDRFLSCGEDMVEALKESDYEQLRQENLQAGSICHGDYNQHNILHTDNTRNQRSSIANARNNISGSKSTLTEPRSIITDSENPITDTRNSIANQELIAANQGIIITNFDHWNYDIQTADLYHFMRKILEKHDWDVAIGTGMLETYEKVRPLSEAERYDLKLRLSYPWKFWKLVNHYSNNNKVWISVKNVEKLEKLQNQYKNWQIFLKNMF